VLHGELAVWRDAAALRDRAVASGRSVLTAWRCDDGRFSGVPDSFDGVHVFRNGFRQALGLPNTARPVADHCVFEWQDGGFRPAH
jgi:hypothetical protein